MKMMEESKLRELLEEMYKAGAERVRPEEGFEFMELGHNPDDWDVMNQLIDETIKKV